MVPAPPQSPGSEVQPALGQILMPSLHSCASVSNAFSLSEPQFSHVYNGDKNSPCLMGLLGEFSEMVYTQHLAQSRGL